MQCDDSIPVSDDPRHGSAHNNINIMHNRAEWVVIDGLEYKKEAAVVYSVEDDYHSIYNGYSIAIVIGYTPLGCTFSANYSVPVQWC